MALSTWMPCKRPSHVRSLAHVASLALWLDAMVTRVFHCHPHLPALAPALAAPHIRVSQTGQNMSQGQADERMMQLLRLLNRLLERTPESRRRALAWYTPIIVPVWPQVCACVRCAQSLLGWLWWVAQEVSSWVLAGGEAKTCPLEDWM